MTVPAPHRDAPLHPGAMLAAHAHDVDVDAALARFHEQGFARLGVVLSDAGARTLQRRADALMTGEVRHRGLFYQHDSGSGRYRDLAFGEGWVGPSLAYRKLEKLELDPCFIAWIENPLFARIARAALGDAVRLYRATLWNKAAHGGTELPWHQDDGSFWGLDRAPFLQIWTALDDAPEDAGCVEVVPASHRDGLASREGGVIPAERIDAAHAAERAVKLPARRGEAILLHNHLWHRSGRNATPAPRRALGISYLHGATRCMRRRRAPREFMSLFQSPGAP